MKYRIPETIIIKQDNKETFKDIIYHELDEQEILLEILKNPKLTYWTEDEFEKKYYWHNTLQTTVNKQTGNITNHTFLSQHLRNFNIDN